jgi:hypothetical protein
MAFSFHHPSEVVTHPQLEPEVKRAILASWASDASAVKNQPALRRAPTGRHVVPIDDVMRALKSLDS